MFELHLNQGFSPAVFWSLKTSPLHFTVIWATGGIVLCIAVFEVVDAQRSCAQLQRVLSSLNCAWIQAQSGPKEPQTLQ